MNTAFAVSKTTSSFVVDMLPIGSAQEIEDAFEPVSRCIQLAPGLFTGFASTIDFGGVVMHEQAANRGIEVCFDENPGVITVGVLIEGERVLASAQQWERDAVYVAPESQVEVSTLRPSHIVWLRIVRDRLSPADRDVLSAMSKAFIADGAQFEELRALLDRTIKQPRTSRDVSARVRPQDAAPQLADALVVALRRVADAARADRMRENRSLALVRGVETYMWENVEEPLTLERICDEMNCGVRALIYAFKNVYGVGPMTYWKSRRLNGAHHKLRRSMGKVPILEIAADFGFWHMGHFSADHKQMFGMTPSEAIEAGRAG